jgi:hypothetical protein
VVTYTYNPRYSRGVNWEDGGLRTTQAKKISKTYISTATTARLSVVVSTCHPSYAGSKNRKTTVQAGLAKTQDC